MNKKVMMMALAMLGIGAMQVSAQDIEADNTAVPQNKMYQPREFTEWAFEGVLMDMNQQTRIDSLNNAVKAKAFAQAQGSNKCDKAKCDKADKAKCDKAKCDRAKCDKAKCDRAKCDKAKCDKADKTKCDKAKCDKADKAKCDKATNGQCSKPMMIKGGPRDKQKAKAPQMQQRPRFNRDIYDEEYIAKVKEILTPEQYTIFLENIVEQPMKFNGRLTDLRPGENARMPRNLNRDAQQVRGIR